MPVRKGLEVIVSGGFSSVLGMPEAIWAPMNLEAPK